MEESIVHREAQRGDGVPLVEGADVIASSASNNSSDDGSQAYVYVGDVDEQVCPRTENSKTRDLLDVTDNSSNSDKMKPRDKLDDHTDDISNQNNDVEREPSVPEVDVDLALSVETLGRLMSQNQEIPADLNEEPAALTAGDGGKVTEGIVDIAKQELYPSDMVRVKHDKEIQPHPVANSVDHKDNCDDDSDLDLDALLDDTSHTSDIQEADVNSSVKTLGRLMSQNQEQNFVLEKSRADLNEKPAALTAGNRGKVNEGIVDIAKQELYQEECLPTSDIVGVKHGKETQPHPVVNSVDHKDNCDDSDLDLDALLDDTSHTSNMQEADVKDKNDNKCDSGGDIGSNLEKSLDVDSSFVTHPKKEALELDAVFGDDNSRDLVNGGDIEKTASRTNEENQGNNDGKKHNPSCSVTIEDKLALQLDELLDVSDGEDHANKFESVVIEEEPQNPVLSNAKNIASMSKALTEKAKKKIQRKNCTEIKRQTQPKYHMEAKRSITSAMSDALLSSTKRVTKTRDRMRHSTQVFSDQMRKDFKLLPRGNNKNVDSKPPSESNTTKRTPLSPTFSSTKKLGQKLYRNGREKKPKPRWGDNENTAGFKNYMKSTSTFTTKVLETQIISEQKAKLKECMNKKIKVDLTFWKTKNLAKTRTEKTKRISSPRRTKNGSYASETLSSMTKVANKILIRRENEREKTDEMRKCFHRNSPRVSPKRTTASPSVKGLPGNVDALRTPDRFFASPPPQIYRTQGSWSKIKGAQNFTTPDAIAKCHESFGNNTGKYHESPLRSITEQSIGSLSSQCTVRSFVSPTKEGILGCQNKFDPFLHKTSGACELCIFRLPDIEKERLDEQGRHLLVQFTTGGCRDCSAFPKASHEPQVRLCQRCYSVSHRQMQTRQRKKGNGSIIGYSFSKVSKGNSVY